jgi:PAS domain S-box-containing protein
LLFSTGENTVACKEDLCYHCYIFPDIKVAFMVNGLLKGAGEYLNLAPGIVIIIDANQAVRFINERGCTLLEAPKEEIIGKNWFDHFLPDEKKEEIRRLFISLLQTKKLPVQHYENSLLTAKRNTKFISWYQINVSEENDRISGILCLGEDITDRTVLLRRLSMQEEEKRRQLVSAVIEAQEKERQEIAAELHDNVNQVLTTCKLLMEQEVYNGNTSLFVTNTGQYLQNAIDEIRNISHRLNPGYSKETSFEQAVEEMIGKINLTSKLKATVVIKGTKFLNDLPASISLSVFRMLQEQVSNIIKHAEASKIKIAIYASEDAVDFEVRDNGKGFDLKEASKGLGLKNIYSRAELHNGTVYIDAAPGKGCLLSVHIPVS